MKSHIRYYAFVLICFCTLLSGCSSTQWQTSEMNTANIQDSLVVDDYDGEIPEALSDWDVIADISDQWYPCNYEFISKLHQNKY